MIIPTAASDSLQNYPHHLFAACALPLALLFEDFDASR